MKKIRRFTAVRDKRGDADIPVTPYTRVTELGISTLNTVFRHYTDMLV